MILWRYVVFLMLLMAASPLAAQQNPDGQLSLGRISDPYLLLLRDPEVFRILSVTPTQKESLAKLSDRLDEILWPRRNHGADAATASWAEATKLARREAPGILTSAQQKRFDEIVLWLLETRALARDDVAQKLGFSAAQRESIRKIMDSTAREIVELEKKAAAGEPAGPLEKKSLQLREAEQRSILDKMTEAQKRGWKGLLGNQVDTSKLGRVTFHAPELLTEEAGWLNGAPSADYHTRPVTVVHFFANGCINCIHNYEHYLGWDRSFRDQGVVIVGIHTPETQAERDVERLKRKVVEAGFEFPILIDNGKKNWDAWGNTMWPSVYLVDTQGRIRYWWYGELNWQGAGGEQKLRSRIEELLAEARPKSR